MYRHMLWGLGMSRNSIRFFYLQLEASRPNGLALHLPLFFCPDPNLSEPIRNPNLDLIFKVAEHPADEAFHRHLSALSAGPYRQNFKLPTWDEFARPFKHGTALHMKYETRMSLRLLPCCLFMLHSFQIFSTFSAFHLVLRCHQLPPHLHEIVWIGTFGHLLLRSIGSLSKQGECTPWPSRWDLKQT